jgi:hypothetical protein
MAVHDSVPSSAVTLVFRRVNLTEMKAILFGEFNKRADRQGLLIDSRLVIVLSGFDINSATKRLCRMCLDGETKNDEHGR